MKKFNKNKMLTWLFFVLSLISLSCASVFTTLAVLNFKYWLIFVIALSLISFVLLLWLTNLKRNGYVLKYYLFQKDFNKKIKPFLLKYPNAPDSFIKEFKDETKSRYRYAGYLFSRDLNESIYKNKQSKNLMINLYQKLYNSIISKGGFIEFFKSLEDLKMEPWEITNYLTNDLISNELDYLLNKVYCITHFTVFDNGLSEEFTKQNNQIIKDLNEIYSPLLFNFKNEIESVLEKLKNQ